MPHRRTVSMMAAVVPCVVALCLVALPGVGQGTQQMVSDADAPLWRAVGVLNVAGNRSCTATLISPTEAITAAHCLFNPLTRTRSAPSQIRFVLGQRRDTYAALRGVTATATLPLYVYGGPTARLDAVAQDLALLQLDAPVTADEARPMQVADWPAPDAGPVTVDIVGYGRDRRYVASLRQGCAVPGLQNGVAALACAVVPGLSGAPVTLPGQKLVAVISAQIVPEAGSDGALAVIVAPHLADLRANLTQ